MFINIMIFICSVFMKRIVTRIPDKHGWAGILQSSTSIMCITTRRESGYPYYSYGNICVEGNHVQGMT